ncbi:BUB protein kinase [Sphaeroforma arctica JP610]|uniref:BUB protein kinase n=1 Tax=Sphaeroforma arctica JP610 TaxID=667725 RepID=A0A0L0GB41_9EUKA|nr:BUB protein kinase [Sphaeroforma arctica JP610]KNC85483.1 BUB protein kinase [Sphaeroforma arctica JP610]|eukprot:XP_014159385.1 BUB protein kinase [Sphaeroforma arctica JP610]
MQADGMQRSDNMRHRENLRQSADTSRSVVAGVRRLSLVAGDSREESGDELTGCGNSAGAERIVGLAEPLERDEGIRIPKYIGTGIGRADRLRDGAPVNARTPAYMSHVRHDIGGPIPYVSDVREPGHTPSATGSRRSSMMNSGQIRRSDSRSGDIRTGDRPFTGDAIGQGKTPGCTGSRRSSLVSSGQLRRNGTTLKPEPELLSNRREGTGSTELANGLSTHDPFEEKNVRACLECVQMPNHCVFRCLEESAPPISDNRKSLRKSVVLADGMAYVVVKCIGVGAWAKVYLAEHTDPPQHHSTQLYAMKVTRRAIGQWESYIAHELQRRFKLLPPHLSTTTNYRVFGQAHNLHVYADAAIVMVDYLVWRIPDSDWSPDKNPDWEEFGLQLIDFGRSVDCALYPAQTQFSGSNKTEGFICMEMAAHRPWRYQVDTFGVLGIIHCLFHKRYMSVEKRGSRWKPKEAFKRYWQADLWAELFDTFLNINPADEAPSLAPYRIRIERELRDPKRVCKLNAQLKEQISLVQRYRASTGGKVRR